LNQLKHLLHDSITTKRPIKIIITSRPHIPVTSYLANVIKLPLAAENLKDDITAFVSASVHTQLQFTGKLGDEVRQALIHGANGMFLWVSLILDDLEHSTNTTPRAIRERLQTLPSDLAGVYTNILRKIRTEDLQTAKSILQWVVWAVRPLNLQELTIAIAIRPEHHASMSSMEDDMHTDLRQVLRLIFGPMLRIEDGGDTVHLVHQSAKDFLSGISSSTKGGLSLPSLVTSSVQSNMQLAASCLAYLSFDECEVGPVAVRRPWEHDVRTNIGILQHKLPFLIYAAAYWPEHVRQVETSDQHQTLCTPFRKLAESRRKIDLAYQVFMFSVSPYKDFVKTNPLQIASSLGLIAFTEELLSHGADINAQGGRYGNALQGAAAGGHEAVFHQLSTRTDIHITKDIVTEIAKKARKGKEIMEVLFNTHPDIEITEAIVIAAAKNSRGKEVMEVLLSARPNIKITEAIVIAAAKNSRGKEVMEVLLSARPNIKITEAIVIAAAKNSRGKEVMEVLLSARPNIKITEPIIIAAAGSDGGMGVMKMLLADHPTIEITEAIVTAAAGNHREKEVMEMLLADHPNIEITEDIVTAVAGNSRGKEVMEMLLADNPNIEITEPIVIAAAGNFEGKEVIEMLLANRPNIKITEAIVIAAAGNHEEKEVMEMLLADHPNIEITEAIVTVAAGNFGGKEVIEMLLANRPNINITEAIVIAAAGNSGGKEVIEMLLADHPNIEITEPIVIAAAGNYIGKEVIEMLLADHPNIEITEAIVTAAAGNYRGKEVIEMLLADHPNIKITEAIVIAAAGNSGGKKVIEMLLADHPNIEITEAIIIAAAGSDGGKGLMEILLSARPNIEITEPIVIAAAGNYRGREVIEMLLADHPNIAITEAIVIAAARNYRGKEVIEILLANYPNFEITEAIVIAAAGNLRGKEVIEMLLSAHPNIEITESIVTAAAGNSSGKEVIKILLSTRSDIVITEPVVTAAAGNSEWGNEVMRLLLDSGRQFGLYPASVQAVAYFGMLLHTKYLVLKCSKITLNEQYTHLLHAAVESGVTDILKIFLELGGNYINPDEHNWTAYMTSCQSRNALALEKFAEMAYPSLISVFPPAKWVSEQACVSIQLQGGGAGLLYSGKGQQ